MVIKLLSHPFRSFVHVDTRNVVFVLVSVRLAFSWIGSSQCICLSCNPGYRGLECEKTCGVGTYGFKCRKNCSPGCYLSNENRFGKRRCHHVTGECLEGCADGFMGVDCRDICLDRYFGPGCNQTCSTNCVNRLCNPVSGHCFDCPSPDFGPFCTNVSLSQIDDANLGDKDVSKGGSLFDTGSLVTSMIGMAVLGVFVFVLIVAIAFLRQRLFIREIRNSGKQAPKWIYKPSMYRGVFANLHGRKKRQHQQRLKYQRYLLRNTESREKNKQAVPSTSSRPDSSSQSDLLKQDDESLKIKDNTSEIAISTRNPRTRLGQFNRIIADKDKDIIERRNRELEEEGIHINDHNYVYMEHFPSIPLQDVFSLFATGGVKEDDSESTELTSRPVKHSISTQTQDDDDDKNDYDDDEGTETSTITEFKSRVTTTITADNATVISILKQDGREVDPNSLKSISSIKEQVLQIDEENFRSGTKKAINLKRVDRSGRHKGESVTNQPSIKRRDYQSSLQTEDTVSKDHFSKECRAEGEDGVSLNTAVKFRGVENDISSSIITSRKDFIRDDRASSYFASVDDDWSPTPSMTSFGSHHYAESSYVQNTDTFAPTSADFNDFETMASSFVADVETTVSQYTTLASRFLNDTDTQERGQNYGDDTISEMSSPALSNASSSRFMNASESMPISEQVDAYSTEYSHKDDKNESRKTSSTFKNDYYHSYYFDKNESKKIFGWTHKGKRQNRSSEQVSVETVTKSTVTTTAAVTSTIRAGGSESLALPFVSTKGGSFSNSMDETDNKVTTGTQILKVGEEEDAAVKEGDGDNARNNYDGDDNGDRTWRNDKTEDENDENNFYYFSHDFLISRFARWEMDRKREKEELEEKGEGGNRKEEEEEKGEGGNRKEEERNEETLCEDQILGKTTEGTKSEHKNKVNFLFSYFSKKK